jgi:hypothetical protein
MEKTMSTDTASINQQRHSDQTNRLHDFISLGEVEAGLLSLPDWEQFEKSQSVTEHCVTSFDDEKNRLPFLLRVLQLSRPLSTIPTLDDCDQSDDNCSSGLFFSQNNVNRKNINETDEQTRDAISNDSIICNAVNRLEERAAVYGIAEGVEIVSCYLSPAVTRYVSRVPRLVPIKEDSITISSEKIQSTYLEKRFDTSLLERSIERTTSSNILGKRNGIGHPASKGKKRRRPSTVGNDSVVHDDLSDSSCEEMINDSKRGAKVNITEVEVHSDAQVSKDSQEATVLKTFQDLARVTVLSLKQSPSAARSDAAMDDENPDCMANRSNRALCISMQDSALSETAKTQQLHQTGICDLPSTVASLLHNSPCLGTRHVAVSKGISCICY